ncbi:Zn-dependent hydrolase [Streptomyces sp. NPDC023998]|uniref:Zn-dependent hydrolase n=1 Tax=Streptomyces sp. NPDC023998 TaxID=3154597 RepID=UPI0033DB838B
MRRIEAATPAAATAVRVKGQRLLHRIDELAKIGATSRGGVSRPAFSSEDRAAQDFLRTEATEAGLRADVDPAGNLLIRRPGALADRPVVLMGSHLDTVYEGGRLDGAYGVVAALEAMQAIVESGVTTAYEPVAVAFANEEGALFPQPFWGSMAIAGHLSALPPEPKDRQGRSLREPLHKAGGSLDLLEMAVWPPGAIAAFLELHIEQGPVLEGRRIPIGVVTDIVGRVAFDVRVHGKAGHAGTTPMALRRDAAVAASHVVLAAQRLAATSDACRVATTGRLSISPDSTNVIPGDASLTVELRDESDTRLGAAAAAFTQELSEISGRTGCFIEARETLRTRPTPTSPELRSVIEESARDLGLQSMSLPSGAGHDAQILASVAPVGMIFVPSLGGLSHVPEEDTHPASLVAGADVLLQSVLSVNLSSTTVG